MLGLKLNHVSKRGHRCSILRSWQEWFRISPQHDVFSYCAAVISWCINSMRPRPNRSHFADDGFKCIFENENEWISPRISLKFVPKVRINNIPALVHIMAWRRPGDKPLSEPMMVSLLTHICVTRPQWVKSSGHACYFLFHLKQIALRYKYIPRFPYYPPFGAIKYSKPLTCLPVGRTIFIRDWMRSCGPGDIF